MKSLNIFGHVINVVSIMSGISALVLSAVTFTSTQVMRTDVSKHHRELGIIPTLSHLNNVTRAGLDAAKVSLKRIDRDVQKLFNDLGRAYEREQKQKVEFQRVISLKLNTTEFEIMKTYKKIKYNADMIEAYYKNLDTRLIVVEKGAEYMKKKIEYLQMLLNNHGKNVTST